MKVLILLTVLGCCYSLPFIQDTPEVIAEKQRFFQLFNAATARASAAAASVNTIGSQQVKHSPSHFSAPSQVTRTTFGWQGPVAATVPAGVNGIIVPVSNTAEVDAAIRSFQLAYDEAVRATAPQSHRFSAPIARHSVPVPVATGRWTGPVAATIPAGLPGSVTQVRNTPEVEAAIAEFTRSYNDAVRSTTGAQLQQVAVHHPSSFRSFSSHQQASPLPVANPRWNGPFAATVPAGLPGSSLQVVDTAEVAAAKVAFNRAFQQQLGFTG